MKISAYAFGWLVGAGTAGILTKSVLWTAAGGIGGALIFAVLAAKGVVRAST